MFWRILRGFFASCRKAALLILLSLTMGTAICAALLTISWEISAKISQEFRAYGANILLTPKPFGSMSCQDLLRIKTLFWRHNILNAVPYLYGMATVTVHGRNQPVVVVGTWFSKVLPLPDGDGNWRVGLAALASWWQITGRWPLAEESDAILIGAAMAKKLAVQVGGRLELIAATSRILVTVTGIVTSGGEEEGQMFAPLELVQQLFQRPLQIDRLLVNALTNPIDDLGRKDPACMTPVEKEKWYCTPYITTVASDLENAVANSIARPLWRIADAEGKIHERLKGLFYFLAILTLFASVLGVGATFSAMVLERRGEIGLLKAIGASNLHIAAIFASQALAIAIVASLAGYILGAVVVQWISLAVFGCRVNTWLVLPYAIGIAPTIALVGVLFPFRALVAIAPVEAMRRN